MSETGAWKNLRNDYRTGAPVAGIPAEDMAKIANVLNTLKVLNGKLVRTIDGNGWTLNCEQEFLGTKSLFKVLMLRAYDIDTDALIAPDVEFDSSTMILRPTWDYPRFHDYA